MEKLSYLFFGACTTIVNIATYYVCARWIALSTVYSTSVAWVLSVMFAYITNKLFVFRSRSWNRNIIIKEAASFFICRAVTGILDVVIMHLGVDVWGLFDIGVKVFSNILVIIMNYIASKLLVFKSIDGKKGSTHEKYS